MEKETNENHWSALRTKFCAKPRELIVERHVKCSFVSVQLYDANRCSPSTGKKTAARNRRHKVFDRRVGILKFDEISTDLYCFIFQFRGGWIFVWGAKPTIAPSWRRDCITNQKHEENVRDENSVDSQLADSIFKWCLSAGYDVIARWSRLNFVHQNVRASPAVLSDLFQQVQQIFVVDVITFANVSDILNLFQVLPTYIYNPSHFVLKTIRQK